ncbi:unnamed protein product [Rhizophagus irregularis]|uniref:Uncharacterized protein n=1 Tax=Rhizophagus irregularis TaxID=588596 RepID=A0A915YV74_9GLOM|nr:unnamed protein product [Rhizophagus irregularis]
MATPCIEGCDRMQSYGFLELAEFGNFSDLLTIREICFQNFIKEHRFFSICKKLTQNFKIWNLAFNFWVVIVANF